jgi:hypothetical protein
MVTRNPSGSADGEPCLGLVLRSKEEVEYREDWKMGKGLGLVLRLRRMKSTGKSGKWVRRSGTGIYLVQLMPNPNSNSNPNSNPSSNPN